MKLSITKIFFFLISVFSLTSCLDGADSNIPPDASGTIMELLYVQEGGTTINSGLNYFSGAAITYPATHEADTATFVVSLAGATTFSKDLTVTLGVDANAVNDNIASDGITYELMPDSLYTFITKTAVIKAGEKSAAFQVIFYPSKIDATKNYGLPVTATNDGSVDISSNFGKVYFHAIGNPIAGAYTWDFERHDSQDKSAPISAASFTEEPTIFAPVNPTTVSVATGYYTQPNYLISFTDTDGVLSNFRAVINPDEIATFTDNGITIVVAPTITVSNNNTKFVINYVVNNGTAFRNVTDTFYK